MKLKVPFHGGLHSKKKADKQHEQKTLKQKRIAKFCDYPWLKLLMRRSHVTFATTSL